MNAIDCTCREHTCYDCRRQDIDARALGIVDREIRICTGMDMDVEKHAWEQANLFRTNAINALAFEFLNR